LADRMASEVRFEIGQIDGLLGTYCSLLQQPADAVPGPVELAAIGSVLHSFYNGLENVLLAIAKGLGEPLPESAQWHRDLLRQMTRQTDDRPSVLSDETARALAEYLAFRHFYRHSYSFHLDWSKLQGLVGSLHATWATVRAQLSAFLDQVCKPPGDTQQDL